MTKVLIVGSGLTGCASAALIKQKVPGADITIWEKARGTGGRMSTFRNSVGPAAGKCIVDLGAQYISLTTQYKDKREKLYADLQAQGILAPLRGKVLGTNQFDAPGWQHYVTPNGVGSLVKHFIQKSNAKVECNRMVTKIKDGEKDQSLQVIDANGNAESFHAVVLTMPVPQILNLKGILRRELENNKPILHKLSCVVYSSRFALGLFFPPGTQLPYQWAAKYFDEDPCIRFVAVDNQKRGIDASAVGPSMVVHTHVQYGLRHVEQDKEMVKNMIMEKVMQCLPDLPQPAEVICQKWRYSQIFRSYADNPGCVVVKTKPLIVLGGDGFSSSTFDGCIDSAEAISEKVTDFLQKSV